MHISSFWIILFLLSVCVMCVVDAHEWPFPGINLIKKIMRVCISYTHLYPIKSLNHTSPSRKCKLYFWDNMQVASTLWPDIKSQKISERRFRLNWTKCSPRTEANPLRISSIPVFRHGQGQTSPTPSSWGQWAPPAGRPTTLVGGPAHGSHRLNLPHGNIS